MGPICEIKWMLAAVISDLRHRLSTRFFSFSCFSVLNVFDVYITHKLIKEAFWIRQDFASFIRILPFISLRVFLFNLKLLYAAVTTHINQINSLFGPE